MINDDIISSWLVPPSEDGCFGVDAFAGVPQTMNPNAAQLVNPGVNGIPHAAGVDPGWKILPNNKNLFIFISKRINKNCVFFFFAEPGVGEGVIASGGGNMTAADAGNYLVD
jgi:hypothetical protein